MANKMQKKTAAAEKRGGQLMLRQVGARVGEFALETGSAAAAGALLSDVKVVVPGGINYGLGIISGITAAVPTRKKWPHWVTSVGRGAFYGQVAIDSKKYFGGSPMKAWAALTKPKASDNPDA